MNANSPRSYWSLSAWVLLTYVIFRLAFLYPKWDNPGTEATLSWDVFGYYLYLPSYFIYDDLSGLEFIDELFKQYYPAGDFHHATQLPDGKFVMKYPIGMAILYLPFFLLAHLIAPLAGFAADGLSWPYQFAISMGCMVYACIGLAILRKFLLKYVSDWTVAWVLAILVLATNYLNYVAYDGAMPHNVLFTLYALLLYLTQQWHERPGLGLAIGIGLVIGLATIVRPIEIISILIPILWQIKDRESFTKKLQLLWKYRLHVLGLGLSMFVMGMIQLSYWKIHSGHWFFYSYGEQGFDWLQPHLIDGLISARKGWLVYTPVMILALVGMVSLFKKYPMIFTAVFAYFILNLYIVFSWKIWWYGGGFGARPLVQSYAVLALPLAVCLEAVRKNRVLTYAIIAFTFLCADLNMIQTWQAHAPNGGLHPEFMTRAYYWKIFGKTKIDKGDKQYLDVQTSLKNTKNREIKPLFSTDFEADSLPPVRAQYAFSGQKALVLDGQYQFSPAYKNSLAAISTDEDSWIRMSARTLYTTMEWNEWQQCQLVSEFVREGKVYKRRGVRVQRLSDAWVWHNLEVERPLYPYKAQPSDSLRIYFWNAGGPQQVFIDDFKVEWISSKR